MSWQRVWPIPSARKVASEVHVNANTVQHAMIFLVHEGLAESHKGKGYSVIKDQQTFIYRCRNLVQRTTIWFLHTMKELGYNRQQIIEAISQFEYFNNVPACILRAKMRFPVLIFAYFRITHPCINHFSIYRLKFFAIVIFLS